MPSPTRDIKALRCPACKRVNRWHHGGVEITAPRETVRIVEAPRVRLVCWCGYGLWVEHWEINPRWLGPGSRGLP